MKKFVLSLFSLGIIGSAFLTPTILASSDTSFWSWTMEHRYINGKDNNELHELNSGDMSLEGSIRISDSQSGAVGPYEVTYEVREDTGSWSPDRSAGVTTATPDLYEDVSVSGNFGDQDAGTYYIVASQANEDGHTKSSNGTLSVN